MTNCPECGKLIPLLDENVVISVEYVQDRYHLCMTFGEYNNGLPRGDALVVVNPGANVEVYLDTFDVDPQRQGLGRAFYKKVEKYLVDRGFKTIYLDYMDENSRIFWEKMGFETTGTATEMVKRLS